MSVTIQRADDKSDATPDDQSDDTADDVSHRQDSDLVFVAIQRADDKSDDKTDDKSGIDKIQILCLRL